MPPNGALQVCPCMVTVGAAGDLSLAFHSWPPQGRADVPVKAKRNNRMNFGTEGKVALVLGGGQTLTLTWVICVDGGVIASIKGNT